MTPLHIAIIGGGAAGYFCAIEAKRNYPVADITIFDYAALHTEADYDHPFRRNRGIEYVIVNGGIAVEHGAFTGLKNGKVLRMSR